MSSPAKGFDYELRTQDIVKRMLFWILDSSVPEIGALPIAQRVWLYANTFRENDPKAVKPLSLRTSSLFRDGQDRSNEVKRLSETIDTLAPFYGHARDFHLNQKTIPPELLGVLQRAADYARDMPKEEACENYEITDIRQLLFLEIFSMIEKNIAIRRCKNCGLYFVMTNHNKEYCDRKAEGKEKSCALVGSKLTFNKKLDGDPELESYNRAYKTHYARRRTGSMTQTEFEVWRVEAKKKLDQVRSGELDKAEFKEWLKI